MFERAEHEYGVPASVITGFWALESDFGAGMGKFPIMPALVTLAYDCRRQVMFQEELKAALQIIDRGDMTPAEMIGSWAGEIGQTQFLPTRYLDHAIDFDGDGRIDLFRDDADVIGSTANYMHHLGWRPNEPWLEEVRITQELPWDQADLSIKLPRSKWAGWGITYPDGSPVPNDNHAGLAAAAHGPLRAGLPRLSQLRHLHGVEQLAHLCDDGGLSCHAHRRRRAHEPRARAHPRALRRRDQGGAAPAWPRAATTSARSTASSARRRAPRSRTCS